MRCNSNIKASNETKNSFSHMKLEMIQCLTMVIVINAPNLSASVPSNTVLTTSAAVVFVKQASLGSSCFYVPSYLEVLCLQTKETSTWRT